MNHGEKNDEPPLVDRTELIMFLDSSMAIGNHRVLRDLSAHLQGYDTRTRLCFESEGITATVDNTYGNKALTFDFIQPYFSIDKFTVVTEKFFQLWKSKRASETTDEDNSARWFSSGCDVLNAHWFVHHQCYGEQVGCFLRCPSEHGFVILTVGFSIE